MGLQWDYSATTVGLEWDWNGTVEWDGRVGRSSETVEWDGRVGRSSGTVELDCTFEWDYMAEIKYSYTCLLHA